MKCLLLVLSAVLLPFCGFAGRFAPNPVSERRCITASEMRILFSDGVPQFEIVIPRNVRLAEAPSHGKPIVLHDPKCAGARAYAALTEEFILKTEDKGE